MLTKIEKIPEVEVASDELTYFEDLARKFAVKSVLPIFEGEHSDGDLGRVPELFETALTIGLASSPDMSMAGAEYGIWGSSAESSGLLPSIVLLGTVAETCGGIATCLNVQGVASILARRGRLSSQVLNSKFSPPYIEL